MTALLGLILAIGIFCWWLSGNWYAWCVTFAGLFVLDVLLFPVGFHPVAFAVFLAAAWLLSALPYFVRIRPPYIVRLRARLFA